MIRILDLVLAAALIFMFGVLIVIVSIMVRITSKGPVLYWSRRVGRDNCIFRMPKFRSMLIETPVIATHLLENADSMLTPIGAFLRRSSIDELPQLWSILKGDMSFVGPRPALYNQYDLIELRTKLNVHLLVPGLTGWAQVNGRDELSIEEKVSYDAEYALKKRFVFDLYILWLTGLKVLRRTGVSH